MPQQNGWPSRFNTPANPLQDLLYQIWVQGAGHSRDVSDYDMPGYFQSMHPANQWSSGHFPDTFKKPNHPTFSVESKYSGSPRPGGGRYVGGAWGDDGGTQTFTPSAEMLQNESPAAMLLEYFRRFEPGARLVLPKGAK